MLIQTLTVYGPWPQSGEIDIAESKGNNPNTYVDGRNAIFSTLHWGPTPGTDAFWRTSGKHVLKRVNLTQSFRYHGPS